jgi:uncharacterized protein YdhG (YjbR/CyaY superfamily)
LKPELYKTIDEYVKMSPADIQKILQQLRQTIHEAAPDAEEVISYQMPAFRQNGILVYFAAFKDHISFFPTRSGIEAFKKELAPYVKGKGTAQFPLDQPIPLDPVKLVVRFRVEGNLRNTAEKKRR